MARNLLFNRVAEELRLYESIESTNINQVDFLYFVSMVHVKDDQEIHKTHGTTTPFVYPPFRVQKIKQLEPGSQRLCDRAVAYLELQHSASEDGLSLSDFLHWSNDEHLRIPHT